MDEMRRAVLAAELDEALHEMNRAAAVVEYLSAKLGVPTPRGGGGGGGDGGGDGGMDAPPLDSQADPVTVVREGSSSECLGPRRPGR